MAKPQNIILLVADSLRWDSVHLKGDHRLPYTASRAIAFDQARSSGCWTLPATASMFTGRTPHEHGATSQTRGVKQDTVLLAERMKAQGYNTHMVTANVATTHIFGLDRGFDSMDRVWQSVPTVHKKVHQALVLVGKPRLRKRIMSKDFVMGKLSEDLEASKTWLQSTMGDIFNRARSLVETNTKQNQSSFLFLNLMEGHFPYHVDDTFRCVSEGMFPKLRELYNLYHFVNQTWLTQHNGELPPQMLDVLRLRQRLAWERMAPTIDAFIQEMREKHNALIVFCSDHGDNFGEQGWQYHFSNVNDAGNRVPLYYLPHDRDEGRVEKRPVSARDLYGTLLRDAGDPDPELPSLILEPERSLSVLESYWYNNRGKTLPEYRHNQFAFVAGDKRYAFRSNRWYEAPITIADETEPSFVRLDDGVNPLMENIAEDDQLPALQTKFTNFRTFSDKVMKESDKHE